MINLDSLAIKAFLEENLDFLLGARLQKVQQPNRRELIFHLRNLSESRKFYININPSFYHICFMSKENESRRFIQIPKSAAMFCMLLRKYIEGAKIVDVVQPDHERIIEFYFDYFDVLNQNSKLCLAIELMGKHSNVILYNSDTNVIIGCAHNVGAEKSKDRELAGLLPYIYPPKQRKKNLLKISFDKFVEVLESSSDPLVDTLQSSFYDLTKPLIESVLADSLIAKDTKRLYEELKKVLDLEYVEPSISKDYSEFSIYPKAEAVQSDCVNSMIDDYFSYHQTRVIVNNLKNKLFTIVNNQLKKLYKLKAKQEYQLSQLDKANLYRKKGDILAANLYQIDSSKNTAMLIDYETNEKIQIDLDTTLSPIENANRYYKLYKKTKASYEYALELVQETNLQIDYYEEQKFYVEISDSISQLEDITLELKQDSSVDSRSKKQKEIPVEMLEIEGFKVFVGKNSKQNDYILSKLSSSEDIWFHPLNTAGAHIILKKNNSKEIIPDKVMLKVAELAKSLSSQKSKTKIPIIYTLRKYVKKANSKGLAFVTYKNESEIYC